MLLSCFSECPLAGKAGLSRSVVSQDAVFYPSPLLNIKVRYYPDNIHLNPCDQLYTIS